MSEQLYQFIENERRGQSSAQSNLLAAIASPDLAGATNYIESVKQRQGQYLSEYTRAAQTASNEALDTLAADPSVSPLDLKDYLEQEGAIRSMEKLAIEDATLLA